MRMRARFSPRPLPQYIASPHEVAALVRGGADFAGIIKGFCGDHQRMSRDGRFLPSNRAERPAKRLLPERAAPFI
jgi:hypothetical protein